MKTSVRLKLNKDRRLNCRCYTLAFLINQCRQQRLIYTGVKVFEESFSEPKQRVVSNTQERSRKGELKTVNEKLLVIKRNIDFMIDFMTMTDETFSTDKLSNIYHRKQHNRYVVTFAESLIDMLFNTLLSFAKGDMVKFEDIDYLYF